MQYVTDLHLHSKYSRAVSKDMTLPIMASYAKKKGIDVLATGDWTHPLWLREIRSQLEEAGEGLYKLKSPARNATHSVAGGQEEKEPKFLLSAEISSIYSQGGKVRRVHSLVMAPSIEVVEKINKELMRMGCNLLSDGRPVIGLSAKNLLELVMSVDSTTLYIPCHIWTPWFSLYGANSGFETLEECFGQSSRYVYGIETGISSDPQMNWRVDELSGRAVLSFSDAHSPAKMGRELTVFSLPKLSYFDIRRAITRPAFVRKKFDDPTVAEIAYTVEFYPEEGKYHYTGHRNCGVIQTPEETREKGNICPVCNKILTVGVMYRVEELATKKSETTLSVDEFGVQWFSDPNGFHPPFVKLVPLLEIIAESVGASVHSNKANICFDLLCERFGTELNVLLKTPIADIAPIVGSQVAQGIAKVRSGEIEISPGYDNTYGIVKIWPGGTIGKIEDRLHVPKSQMDLF